VLEHARILSVYEFNLLRLAERDKTGNEFLAQSLQGGHGGSGTEAAAEPPATGGVKCSIHV
jgi:hypothetical protein